MSNGSGGITCQLSHAKSLFCIIETAPEFGISSFVTVGSAAAFCFL